MKKPVLVALITILALVVIVAMVLAYNIILAFFIKSNDSTSTESSTTTTTAVTATTTTPSSGRWVQTSEGSCYIYENSSLVWKNGLPTGKATIVYYDSNKNLIGTYEGNMENGYRNGHGIYKEPDGSTYTGNFVMGNKDDDDATYIKVQDGKQTWKFCGKFTNNILTYGTLSDFYFSINNVEGVTFEGTGTYVGNFKDGKFDDGDAVFTFNSGEKFVGEFRGGKAINGVFEFKGRKIRITN